MMAHILSFVSKCAPLIPLIFVLIQIVQVNDLKSENDALKRDVYIAEKRSRLLSDQLYELEILDIKNNEALNEAKEKVASLQRDVNDGKQRLQLNANCEPRPVPDHSTPASVDDERAARLTHAAERNYFTLRDQIATITQQVLGLQDYINRVCLR